MVSDFSCYSITERKLTVEMVDVCKDKWCFGKLILRRNTKEITSSNALKYEKAAFYSLLILLAQFLDQQKQN